LDVDVTRGQLRALAPRLGGATSANEVLAASGGVR
jgi:hypothetical protein